MPDDQERPIVLLDVDGVLIPATAGGEVAVGSERLDLVLQLGSSSESLAGPPMSRSSLSVRLA